MSNRIKTSDLLDMLIEIEAKINHIEDLTADNRAIIVKLVKQNNEIVKFLNNLEITELAAEDIQTDLFLETNQNTIEDSGRIKKVKELIDEYLGNDEFSDLKELEEELQKHKSKITPNQIGEA